MRQSFSSSNYTRQTCRTLISVCVCVSNLVKASINLSFAPRASVWVPILDLQALGESGEWSPINMIVWYRLLAFHLLPWHLHCFSFQHVAKKRSWGNGICNVLSLCRPLQEFLDLYNDFLWLLQDRSVCAPTFPHNGCLHMLLIEFGSVLDTLHIPRHGECISACRSYQLFHGSQELSFTCAAASLQFPTKASASVVFFRFLFKCLGFLHLDFQSGIKKWFPSRAAHRFPFISFR